MEACLPGGACAPLLTLLLLLQERLTAKEALAHPYFALVRQQEALAQ